MKTFAGKNIIHEIDGRPEEYAIREYFELVVQLRDFRVCAKAYKSAVIGSTTYVALVEAWGVNFHVSRWFRDEPMKFQSGISTFAGAKKIATTWLREVCKQDEQESDK